jgi:hypothetical protein
MNETKQSLSAPSRDDIEALRITRLEVAEESVYERARTARRRSIPTTWYGYRLALPYEQDNDESERRHTL